MKRNFLKRLVILNEKIFKYTRCQFVLFPKFLNLENCFTVLCYHRILNEFGPCYFEKSIINASPEVFQKEILFLTKYFNIISLEEAINALVDKSSLPKNCLVMTFDDGYKDNYIDAFPVLKKYNIPATIFLTSDFIDNDTDLIWADRIAYSISKTKEDFVNIAGLGSYNLANRHRKERAKIAIGGYLKSIDNSKKNKIVNLLSKELKVDLEDGIAEKVYLSSKEILEMSKNGISFGSHGCSHSILTRISLNRAREEIRSSKAKIEQITGKKVDFFAYPNGTLLDFNNEIISIVKEAGYKAAFTVIPGVNINDESPNLFSLKRIPAGRSFRDFKKSMFLYI